LNTNSRKNGLSLLGDWLSWKDCLKVRAHYYIGAGKHIEMTAMFTLTLPDVIIGNNVTAIWKFQD
jgi:hypothetical protein